MGIRNAVDQHQTTLSALLALGLALAASSASAATLVASGPGAMNPVVAALPDGGWAIAWDAIAPTTLPAIRVGFLEPSGTPRGSVWTWAQGGANSAALWPRLAVGENGQVLVVFRVGRYDLANLFVQRFAPSGEPLGVERRLVEGVAAWTLGSYDVVSRPGGGWFVVWTEVQGDPSSPAAIRALTLDGEGAPVSGPRTLSPPDGASHADPALARRPGGLVAAWLRTFAEPTEVGSTVASSVVARRLDAGGDPLDTLVPIRIEDGSSQRDQAPALSSAGGSEGRAAWFSVADSTRVPTLRTRRLLEGAPVGNMLELAALPSLAESSRPRLATDLRGRFIASWTEPDPDDPNPDSAHRLVVQSFGPDAAPLGAKRVLGSTWGRPPGVAMQGDGKWAAAWDERLEGGDSRIWAEVGALANGCEPSGTNLCLTGGRFRVEAEWEDHRGGQGVGHARPLTAESGAFWFFGPENVELVVKVLDACRLPDFRSYWVFASGLTDVGVEITVTDTATGAAWTYHNPRGRAFPPAQDTTALRVCP